MVAHPCLRRTLSEKIQRRNQMIPISSVPKKMLLTKADIEMTFIVKHLRGL